MFNNIKIKRLRKKGQKLLTNGYPELAMKKFRKVLLLDSSSENQFNLGLALLSSYNYLEAENFFRMVMESHPGNQLNLVSLAEALIMQKKWDNAKIILNDLIQIAPNNVVFDKHLNMVENVVSREKYVKSRELMKKAELEQQNKNFTDALILLQEALEFDPKNALILNNIGSVYQKLKNYQEAYNHIEQAHVLDPNNKNYRRNLVEIKKELRK